MKTPTPYAELLNWDYEPPPAWLEEQVPNIYRTQLLKQLITLDLDEQKERTRNMKTQPIEQFQKDLLNGTATITVKNPRKELLATSKRLESIASTTKSPLKEKLLKEAKATRLAGEDLRFGFDLDL